MNEMMLDYGIDDNPNDYMDFPVMNFDAPHMDVSPFDPVPASEPTPEPAPVQLVIPIREHRVGGQIGEVRRVMRMNGLAGIRQLRPHNIPDDTATVVYLPEEAIALVFDHQSEQWDGIRRVMDFSIRWVEAVGRVQPAQSVPFDVSGVSFCMVDPTVRFHRVNTLGMADDLVDLVVEHGEVVQQDHRELAASTREKEREERLSPRPRATPAPAVVSIEDRVKNSKPNRKGAIMRALGTIGSGIGKMGRGVGRGIGALAGSMRRTRTESWEQRTIEDCRGIIGLVGEVIVERRHMVDANAPRLDVVEIDRALVFLQHSVVRRVRDMAVQPGHPLGEEAMALILEVGDLIADAQGAGDYLTHLRGQMSPLQWLGVRASAYASPTDATRPDALVDPSGSVDRVIDICLTGNPADRRESVEAGVTNQVALS